MLEAHTAMAMACLLCRQGSNSQNRAVPLLKEKRTKDEGDVGREQRCVVEGPAGEVGLRVARKSGEGQAMMGWLGQGGRKVGDAERCSWVQL